MNFWYLMLVLYIVILFFFFKQKTAYEMRISDWSSDVCSSDLRRRRLLLMPAGSLAGREAAESAGRAFGPPGRRRGSSGEYPKGGAVRMLPLSRFMSFGRSEKHTSELQSLMRISYAVFCLKKKTHPRLI